MNIERILESFFDANNLAVFFFLLACILLIQHRGLDRELDECRYWSSQAYSRFAPAAKQELDGEWEEYINMLEAMADRHR